MAQPKTAGWSGRGAPQGDPAQIWFAMLDLHHQETEFQIKVEGTHTLPYTTRVQSLDREKGLLFLKLLRPLPHELAREAPFVMLFTAEDQRFEAPTLFQGREGHLLYRFTLPALLVPSDRRRHKRYPFRPREKAYVVAQDGMVPGHGLSGPLVNLCLGGLAFRVDRVLRLDDHMRITPGLSFYERGKDLPSLGIRDLPGLPVFQCRGVLANAIERDGEIIVGVQFGELKEAELKELQGVLNLRDLKQRAAVSLGTEAPREATPRTAAPPGKPEPAGRMSPAGAVNPEALLRLGRRSTRVLLAMAAGPDREGICAALGEAGYLMVDQADSLDQALADLPTDRQAVMPILLIEGPTLAAPPSATLRTHRQSVGDWLDLPVAMISPRGQPLPPSGDPGLRTIPWPETGDAQWTAALDDLAGIL
ncbi:MAG: PilZ domain-containing protein [Holophagaceae bacterium]